MLRVLHTRHALTLVLHDDNPPHQMFCVNCREKVALLYSLLMHDLRDNLLGRLFALTY